MLEEFGSTVVVVFHDLFLQSVQPVWPVSGLGDPVPRGGVANNGIGLIVPVAKNRKMLKIVSNRICTRPSVRPTSTLRVLEVSGVSGFNF